MSLGAQIEAWSLRLSLGAQIEAWRLRSSLGAQIEAWRLTLSLGAQIEAWRFRLSLVGFVRQVNQQLKHLQFGSFFSNIPYIDSKKGSNNPEPNLHT